MHSVFIVILVHGSCSLRGAEYGTKPRVQLGLQYEGKVNVLGKQLGKVKPGAGAWKGAFGYLGCICELEIHLGGCQNPVNNLFVFIKGLLLAFTISKIPPEQGSIVSTAIVGRGYTHT